MSLSFDRFRRAALAALLLCAFGVPAIAEDAPGIRAGGLVLHPHLRLDTGYDSNVFSEAVSEEPVATPMGRVNPFLIILTETPRVFEFNADIGAGWTQYFNSADENVRRQSGLDLNADVGVRFNASGLVSVKPSDRLRRTTRPSFNEAGDAYRTLSNEVNLELALHPGGALRADRLGFSGRLVGTQRIWRFADQPSLDRNGLGGLLELRWNFLPKTAVFIASSISTVRYEEPLSLPSDSTAVDSELSALSLTNVDASPLRAVAGLSGLITRRLSVLLQVGYGASLHAADPKFAGVIGEARASVDVTRSSLVSLGYRRDFSVGSFANFFTFHSIDLRAELRAAMIRAEVSAFVRFNDYSPVENPSGLLFIDGASPDLVERNDTTLGGSARVGFDVTPWFYIGVEYQLDSRSSNLEVFPPAVLEVPPPDPSRVRPSSPGYVRHQAFLTLDFHY